MMCFSTEVCAETSIMMYWYHVIMNIMMHIKKATWLCQCFVLDFPTFLLNIFFWDVGNTPGNHILKIMFNLDESRWYCTTQKVTQVLYSWLVEDVRDLSQSFRLFQVHSGKRVRVWPIGKTRFACSTSDIRVRKIRFTLGDKFVNNNKFENNSKNDSQCQSCNRMQVVGCENGWCHLSLFFLLLLISVCTFLSVRKASSIKAKEAVTQCLDVYDSKYSRECRLVP